MIIQSIRLKNIKSYGEGPDEQGITVEFQSGVNRIAGLNGNGKTTLIECLGYALFLANPVFEENFRVETYFLRHGAKTGEIDVTFSFEGGSYRIERGVGQTRRRSKVVQTSDGSICAENDDEVEAFLRRLLGIPSSERLSELFSKLIGVKQGRLTWPFDSKGSDAKRFFEPLLEVEVFRQCWDRLLPVVRHFEEEQQEHKTNKAVAESAINERADSKDKLVAAQQAVSALTDAIGETALARSAAEQEWQKQERFKNAAAEATTAYDSAKSAAANAASSRVTAQQLVTASEQAASEVTTSTQGHKAYQAAELALAELEATRGTRDALNGRRATAEDGRKDREGKATAARRQQEFFAEQHGKKEQELGALDTEVAALRNELESSKQAFQQAQQAAVEAAHQQTIVGAWARGLARIVERLDTDAARIATLDEELSAWESEELAAARTAEHSAAEALGATRDLLAGARERKAMLAEQLEQIGGGVCPILREGCRQFDPAKVACDLSIIDSEVGRLASCFDDARQVHESATTVLKPLLDADSQLAGKRSQRAHDISTYAEDLDALVPAECEVAIPRLRAWLDCIDPAPQRVTRQHANLTASHVADLQQALAAFADAVESWWADSTHKIGVRLNSVWAERDSRTTKEAGLKSGAQRLDDLKVEVERLLTNAEAQAKRASALDVEGAAFGNDVRDFEEQLKPFSSLDRDIEAHTSIRATHKPDYERFLTSKTLADDVEPRRRKLEELKDREKVAADDVTVKRTEAETAQESFDPSSLELAKNEYARRIEDAAAAVTNSKHAKSELTREKARFDEWTVACSKRDAIEKEVARCDAAIVLTELARKTLRDAAPKVAEHLCNRIAARAQAVFNRINPDPVELQWRAENYSLRITPGDRRFAMLSGGEQTKVALAMTLAMVEEFSGLRFCIFDEPTYGVDAGSRLKLADAILEMQQAAGLEQLFLVSHDDAFEGKTEHSILLQKSAANGTAVALVL